MVEFRSPTFAKLTKKFERAQTELDKLSKHADERREAVVGDAWDAVTAAGSGVHNVYNGIEDILQTLAKDIDGSVPDGPSMHQDLLDQMAAGIAEVRDPLLTEEMHRNLSELKNFRHLVRHRYGIELDGAKVMQNVDLVRRVFPDFVGAIVEFEDTLLAEPAEEVRPEQPEPDPFKSG